MEYRTREAALRAWWQFIKDYYNGTDDTVGHTIQRSERGHFMVRCYSLITGQFLTYV